MEPVKVWPVFLALVLIGTANGVPILAKWWLGDRWARPLDAGLRLCDGEPLFGPSKTVRGLALGLVMAALVSGAIGLGVTTGLVAGTAAMAGDLLSSFTKRRLKLKPSSMAPGLDQIPESLLPLLAVAGRLGLRATDVLAGVAVFWIAELVLSRVLFLLRIRDRPY